MLDKLLEQVGLKYEDLNKLEKDTLDSWVKALQQNKVTPQTVKDYIGVMRESVEKDLTVAKLGSKQDLFLKARLRNYMLLEAFLTTPEKAKVALERAISGLVTKKGA